MHNVEILQIKCTIFDFRCGSQSPTLLGELTALPTSVAGFSVRRGYQGRMEREGKGGEDLGRKGKIGRGERSWEG